MAACSRMLGTSTLIKMLRLSNSSAYGSPFSTFIDSSSSSPIHNKHTDDNDGRYYSDSQHFQAAAVAVAQDDDEGKISDQGKESNSSAFKFMLDHDAARIRLEIPGVDKQNLKLWFDKDALNFEATTEDEEFGVESFFEGAVEMPVGLLQLLKVEKTKVDLKNGVVKVVIPKLQLEERSDVFIVNVSSSV
ncbi:hypothetical protein BUALT_Bualt05G0075500 [Buddleja alternifolia]|uniref:SHSP domain-containing protein n=1 Tax=Buddleja alternifolia TaxID=168488 RepID=A0AAV6XHB2_9LAMI|nr:hypothetical protein BUALT_Bualt05G0075500 [Buddleja alternifolia]